MKNEPAYFEVIAAVSTLEHWLCMNRREGNTQTFYSWLKTICDIRFRILSSGSDPEEQKPNEPL